MISLNGEWRTSNGFLMTRDGFDDRLYPKSFLRFDVPPFTFSTSRIPAASRLQYFLLATDSLIGTSNVMTTVAQTLSQESGGFPSFLPNVSFFFTGLFFLCMIDGTPSLTTQHEWVCGGTLFAQTV